MHDERAAHGLRGKALQWFGLQSHKKIADAESLAGLFALWEKGNLINAAGAVAPPPYRRVAHYKVFDPSALPAMLLIAYYWRCLLNLVVRTEESWLFCGA